MTTRNGNDIIDLQKLTQRELLIRLHDKVEHLNGKFDDNSKVVKDLEINYAKLETKVKTQSTIFGSISGLITGIFGIIINFLFK